MKHKVAADAGAALAIAGGGAAIAATQLSPSKAPAPGSFRGHHGFGGGPHMDDDGPDA